MKALILKEYNHLQIVDVPEPELSPDDVLIHVKACGICGSDVHGMDGSTGRRRPPIIMGHEAAGIITRTGAGVSEWKAGEHVTFDSTIYCGSCHFCRRGLINLCDNRRVLGVSCDEYSQNGALAEYIAVPQHILYRLPEGLSFEQAALIEPLSVAFHAVERTPMSLNDTAVVFGAGIIGLLLVQTLRIKGCGKIIAVDIDQCRLDMACRLGADVGFNPENCDVVREVQKITGDRSADRAFEAVGITTTIETAVATLRKGGSLTLVGNLSPVVEIPLQKIVAYEISLYGSCASQGEYPACLDMIANGAIIVDQIISAVAPLEDGVSWFKRLYDCDPGLLKVILVP